jgi:hypothetical protein
MPIESRVDRFMSTEDAEYGTESLDPYVRTQNIPEAIK